MSTDMIRCGNVKIGGYICQIAVFTNSDKTKFWLDAEHARRSLYFNIYDRAILQQWKSETFNSPSGYIVDLDVYDKFVTRQLYLRNYAIELWADTDWGGNIRGRNQSAISKIVNVQKLIHDYVDTLKRQDNYKTEEPIMKSNYNLRETKRITTPNGTTLRVLTDGVNDFVKTTEIAQALGYSAFVCDNSLLALVFKNNNFHIFKKPITKNCRPSYLNTTKQVVPILEAFIRLTLMTRQTNPVYLAKMDDARMEAERLIPVFKREVLGEACDDEIAVTKSNALTVDVIQQNQEVTQMENNNTIQTTVPVVTLADIEDIGERTEAVMKVFGSLKVDALRAVTKLKAQEINRDLQPLLDLLGE